MHPLPHPRRRSSRALGRCIFHRPWNHRFPYVRWIFQRFVGVTFSRVAFPELSLTRVDNLMAWRNNCQIGVKKSISSCTHISFVMWTSYSIDRVIFLDDHFVSAFQIYQLWNSVPWNRGLISMPVIFFLKFDSQMKKSNWIFNRNKLCLFPLPLK